MKPSKLYVVPIQLSENSLLDPLLTFLAHSFHVEAEILRKELDLAQTYNSERDQYYSSAILAQLIENPPADAFRMLGVTGLDIYIPVLTYLFGEAQFKGMGALVSAFRLRNEFYGRPPDMQLFQERLLKEAIHELGHTYGLRHCNYPGCVMNSSTYIDDVDEKMVSFCRVCADIVKAGSP
ncbi:MAG: archaemetzincin family Zn-dependent metalloprotease [bacterium]